MVWITAFNNAQNNGARLDKGKQIIALHTLEARYCRVGDTVLMLNGDHQYAAVI